MLCSRVQNLISAYCDRELTGAEMLQIERHLGACPACQQEYAAIRRVKTAFGLMQAVEPRRPFSPEMMDACAPSRRWTAWELGGTLRLPANLRGRLAALDWAGGPLVFGAGLAVLVLAVGVLQRPQHSDAVAAHVPGLIEAEETAPPPVFFRQPEPVYFSRFPGSRWRPAGTERPALPGDAFSVTYVYSPVGWYGD